MLVFDGAPNLRIELGAHLLEQLSQAAAGLWARRHASMRVVHVVGASFAALAVLLRLRALRDDDRSNV